MMTNIKIVFSFLLFMIPASVVADDLTRIRQNLFQMIVPSGEDEFGLKAVLDSLPKEEQVSDQVVVELLQSCSVDRERVGRYISSQCADGSWSDINYQDTKRSGWEPKVHTERILELTKAFQSENSEYYHALALEKTIHRALDYWFKAGLVCRNWWYNQIGIPKTLGTAFLLFESYLTPAEKENAVELMHASKMGMTGQNKVWLAGNVMMRALLQNDAGLVRAARDTIVSEIVTGREEGIQNDWSFHQHGSQQQFGNYGLAFVSAMSFYSGLFAGTSMAFDKAHLDIITNLIDNGYRWTLWCGRMDINALGRQLFHHASVHKALALAFAATELGGGKDREAGEVARNLLDENYGACPDPSTHVGHRHFWKSDYTIHRSPRWMASLKMASTRVWGVESLNGDNMLGYYMGDGAVYVYMDGDEYLDIFPLWNWRRLPGVTALQDDAPMPLIRSGYEPGNDASFVGGVSNGRTGVSAMVLERAGVSARKSWIFTDDFMLCLGAGIEADSCLAVATSVEQCWHRGEAMYLHNGEWKVLNGRMESENGESRLFHDGVGYIAWEHGGMVAETSRRSGCWHDVMQMYSPEEVSGDVFSLYLNHGIRPEGACYQYIVLPGTDRERVRSFDLSSIKILRNDEVAQIVFQPSSSMYWIVAYAPVSFRLKSGETVSCRTPGGYMLHDRGENGYTLWAADFDCAHESGEVVVGRKAVWIPYPEEKGKTIEIKF